MVQREGKDKEEQQCPDRPPNADCVSRKRTKHDHEPTQAPATCQIIKNQKLSLSADSYRQFFGLAMMSIRTFIDNSTLRLVDH